MWKGGWCCTGLLPVEHTICQAGPECFLGIQDVLCQEAGAGACRQASLGICPPSESLTHCTVEAGAPQTDPTVFDSRRGPNLRWACEHVQ